MRRQTRQRTGITGWGVLLFLLAVKPFAELTWSVNLFSFGGLQIRGTQVFSAIFLVAAVMIYLGRARRPTFCAFAIMVFLAILALATGLATTTGELRIGPAIDRLLRVASVYLVYLVFTRIWLERPQLLQLVRVIWLCNLGALLTSLGGWVFGASVGQVASREVVRFTGFHHDPGSIAISALLVLVFGVLHQALLKSEDASGSWIFSALMILTFVCSATSIGMSLTKSVLATTLLFVLLWWGFFHKKHYLVLPAIVLSIFIAFTESESLQTRFTAERTVFLEGNDAEANVRTLASGRVGVWKDLIEHFLSLSFYKQLFGTGFTLGAHNQYLGFLLMGGILGLALFLVIHFGLVLVSYKLYLDSSHPAAFMASALMTLFLVLSLSGTYFMLSHAWYPMILASLVNAPGMVGAPVRRARILTRGRSRLPLMQSPPHGSAAGLRQAPSRQAPMASN